MRKKRRKFLITLFFAASIVIAASLFFVWKFVEGPKLIFSSEKVEQGDTLVVRLNGVWRTPVEARLSSKPISFFRRWLNYFAIIGIDAKSKPEKISFYAKLASGEELTRELMILPRPVKKTKLVIPQKMAKQGINAEILINNIVSGDKPVLDSIFKIFTPKVSFDRSFMEPLNKWIDVGNFGTLRQSSSGSVYHFGVDLEANLGDPVFSINDGTVRFVEELPDFGKTVIIDHGMGIFSGYLHLSEIKTTVNTKVKKGEIIGLIGSTGYSLTPHLHFTVKIDGDSIDPRKFLDTVNKFIK